MQDSNHFMSTVKVGIKGQIVIPKEIRDMFAIAPGDPLIIMADKNRGIAIQKAGILDELANMIFAGQGAQALPNEKESDLAAYAQAIKNTLNNESKE